MGHRFRYLCQTETRRLLLLMGMAFAVVLLVQYFEHPYGYIISSLFTAGKAQDLVIGSLPAGDSSHNHKTLGNTTLFNTLNSTDTNAVHEIVNATKTSEGKDIGLRNDFVSERNGVSNNSLTVEEDIDPEDESPSKDFAELNNNSTVENTRTENGLATGKGGESEYNFLRSNVSADSNSSSSSTHGEDIPLNADVDPSLATPSFPLQPVNSTNFIPPTNLGTKQTPMISINPNTSSSNKDSPDTLPKDEKPQPSQSVLALSENSSSISNLPAMNKRSEEPTTGVFSISDMNDLLLQSRASSFSMKPRWSSAVDKDLLNVKSQIENAPIIRNDPELYASLYRNVSMFKRSYELMEKTIKVYIYKEGARPIFHVSVLKGIYASEGWFMKQLKANRQFVTKNPRKAHLFYLPFSSRMLEETLYVPNSHSHKNLIQHLKNYLDTIVGRYNFWNRTGGADHFLVACHDWAPSETKQHMGKCIRALCNSDIKEGFKFGKDVSLPETYVKTAQKPLRELGGKPPSQRRILAFFAGNMHGYLRPILLKYWENKDPDMKIFGRLPKVKGKMNYVQYMKSSKYCICAKGYEVNSPRVVEAFFHECVPVILSDNFVPPFFEVLNWESFAVFVLEKDIPNLKSILLSIPDKRYLEMQRRVKKSNRYGASSSLGSTHV
ncbi:probable glycosyltransferase At5g03795 isoform X2 [Cornus florida]|uniref:probable glycosyltransferase At5g03795 isoform X2 n=1 Tax=Cornus florida TaxID=4283 RepID=UPI00289D6E5E|nr:probable glycosyltransferase At5g03795 isoform X2 [Cornus florida]